MENSAVIVVVVLLLLVCFLYWRNNSERLYGGRRMIDSYCPYTQYEKNYFTIPLVSDSPDGEHCTTCNMKSSLDSSIDEYIEARYPETNILNSMDNDTKAYIENLMHPVL